MSPVPEGFQPMSAGARAALDQRVARWTDKLRRAGVDLDEPATRKIATALLVDLVECLNCQGPRDPMGTAGAAMLWVMHLSIAVGGDVLGIATHHDEEPS